MREITALLIIVIASLNSQIASAGESSLTIYNQDFAVVREMVPLELGKGVNDVSFTGITTHMEPDSVILRDPEGKAFNDAFENPQIISSQSGAGIITFAF